MSSLGYTMFSDMNMRQTGEVENNIKVWSYRQFLEGIEEIEESRQLH